MWFPGKDRSTRGSAEFLALAVVLLICSQAPAMASAVIVTNAVLSDNGDNDGYGSLKP